MNRARLLWLVRRSRNMRRGELSYRLANAAREAADYISLSCRGKSSYARRCAPESFVFCRSTRPLLPEIEWEFAPSRETIERWLSGKYEGLGGDWTWRGAPDDWHRAPDTNRLWPRKFSPHLDFRPGNPVGDARTTWEPNRLQHLVGLALVARLHPERAREAAEAISGQVQSWLSANPAQCGVNYASALECALRILSVSFASDLIRPYLSGRGEYWSAVGKLILEHAAIVHDKLSLFSSSGNHTVGECAGLFVAALLFPEAGEAQAWEGKASAHLLAAARELVLPDGGAAEQAFHYHAQVIDYLYLATAVGRHFGRDVAELAALHEKGARFLAAFGSRRDELPNVGDDDEGYVLSRYMRPSWAKLAQGSAATQSSTPISCFTAGGYTRIRSVPDGADLIIDHGPLGYPPNFAHGHADALALVLRVGGRPVLTDCGTFSYGAEGDWRAYFRDTAAHNTIVVDDVGQAKQTGPFLWSGGYECRLLHVRATAESAVLLAQHDAYRDLGVIHLRALRVAVGRVVILDRLVGSGRHSLALRWHFASCPARAEGGYVLTDDIGCRCKLTGGSSESCTAQNSRVPVGFRHVMAARIAAGLSKRVP